MYVTCVKLRVCACVRECVCVRACERVRSMCVHDVFGCVCVCLFTCVYACLCVSVYVPVCVKTLLFSYFCAYIVTYPYPYICSDRVSEEKGRISEKKL